MLEANIHEVESGKTVEDVERENRHEEWLKTLEEVKRRLAHGSSAGHGADGSHTRCGGVSWPQRLAHPQEGGSCHLSF